MASASCRSSLNFEMSAPDANALPPAPVTTITRTDGSALKSAMISSAASHMSSEMALWRSGLLKIIQPTPSALRDIIRSLGMRVSSNDVLALQPLDVGVAVAEIAQHLDGVLAGRRRMRCHLARRAAQRHRLPEVGDVA